MRILFDHGTPAPLRKHLKNHHVSKAKDKGWDELRNGDLIAVAKEEGFDLLLTTDKNLAYQQNLSHRKIAILVISNAQWPYLQFHVDLVIKAIETATPGSYAIIEVP